MSNQRKSYQLPNFLSLFVALLKMDIWEVVSTFAKLTQYINLTLPQQAGIYEVLEYDAQLELKDARGKRGLSQDYLGNLVGKDQKAISEYENGQRRVNAVDVPLFAKALEVSILYFYIGDITSQDLDETLLTEFHRLPNEQDQEVAIEMVRLFSNTVERHTT